MQWDLKASNAEFDVPGSRSWNSFAASADHSTLEKTTSSQEGKKKLRDLQVNAILAVPATNDLANPIQTIVII